MLLACLLKRDRVLVVGEPQAEMPLPLHKPQDDDKGLVAVLAASSYGLGTHRTCLFAWEGAL